jgi:hypothetical protein
VPAAVPLVTGGEVEAAPGCCAPARGT